jgi:predicted double-glycine peptidase
MKRWSRLIIIMCALALPVCCATNTPDMSGEAVMIDGLPFFGQDTYQCGPTALATVVDYWNRKTGMGKWVTPEQVAAEIYSPTAKGVLGVDLEIYAKRHGFKEGQYSGTLRDLRAKVDAGIPVIIFVDYGVSVYHVNHFMVVTGYRGDGVLVNSGRHENFWISGKELEKIWKKNGYWSLALRPSP